MDLRQIESFVAVAEELHFGRAAKRIHRSQPAISQQIKRLEQELGFELLTRAQRRVELTAAGATFLEHARRVLDDVDQMVTASTRTASGRTGAVRIGHVGSALFEIVPAVVRAMRTDAPDVHLTLIEQRTDEQLAAIRHGRLDGGFIRAPRRPPDDMVMTPLRREPIGMAVPADHPLATEAEIDLAMLADEPFVLLPRHVEPDSFDQLTAACSAAGFSPQPAQTGVTTLNLLGLVASGFGVAFIAHSVMENSQRDGVAFVALRPPAPELTMALIRPATVVNPAVEVFAQVAAKVWPVDESGNSSTV